MTTETAKPAATMKTITVDELIADVEAGSRETTNEVHDLDYYFHRDSEVVDFGGQLDLDIKTPLGFVISMRCYYDAKETTRGIDWWEGDIVHDDNYPTIYPSVTIVDDEGEEVELHELIDELELYIDNRHIYKADLDELKSQDEEYQAWLKEREEA